MITYRLSHPQLSHPLTLDSTPGRDHQTLVAWARMYLLRYHDVRVESDGWTVEEVGHRG